MTGLLVEEFGGVHDAGGVQGVLDGSDEVDAALSEFPGQQVLEPDSHAVTVLDGATQVDGLIDHRV